MSLEFLNSQFLFGIIIVLHVWNNSSQSDIPSDFTNLNLLTFHICWGNFHISIFIFVIWNNTTLFKWNVFKRWSDIYHIAFVCSKSPRNLSWHKCFIMTSSNVSVFLGSSHHAQSSLLKWISSGSVTWFREQNII
jgi:hypothetical protein